MWFVTLLCLLLTAGYVALMLTYHKGWGMQPVFEAAAAYQPVTKITVVIPARNEADNIGACVRSILNQTYPAQLFEVIVIDDHSTDDTAAIVNGFNDARVRCLSLAAYVVPGEKITAYKKKALATAIGNSTGALIVTTDADCVMLPCWLRDIASVYEQDNAVMVAGPVAFTNDNSIVQIFQSIDFMSMQGITVAAHQMGMGNMCNGANLAFSRAAYNQVGGYAGIDHLSSGDDYLLMMKLQKVFPGRISYLKSRNSIVATAPQPTWRSFLQQRIRWASKSGKYDDKKLTNILVFVYVFNVSFAALFIGGFFRHSCWLLAILMLVVKIVVELYYLRPVAKFFNKSKLLRWFAFLQPLHILYIIAAGFLGFIGVYQWKGRQTK